MTARAVFALQCARCSFALLLLLIPLSLALATWLHAPAPLGVRGRRSSPSSRCRITSARATEQVARTVGGSAIGGLLNVTFGNAAELILAIFILRAGSTEVVKAQITGSFIGNGLLGLGLAIVAGSIGREKQVFKKERASLLSSMLILCVIALLLPALFDYTVRHSLPAPRSAAARTEPEPRRGRRADRHLRRQPRLHAGHPPRHLRHRGRRQRDGGRLVAARCRSACCSAARP